MARPDVGMRVLAVLGAKPDGVVEVFGEGVRLDDAVPDERAFGFMAEAAREHGLAGPAILLDAGGVVYGCECWWGSPDAMRRRLDDATTRLVSLADVRDRYWRERVDGA